MTCVSGRAWNNFHRQAYNVRDVKRKTGVGLGDLVKNRLHKKDRENQRRISRYSRMEGRVSAVSLQSLPVKRKANTGHKNRIWIGVLLIFVIVILFRAVSWLNEYSLLNAVQTIENKGLDYDYFREMLLPEGIYRGVSENYQKGTEKQGEDCTEYAAIFTLLKQNSLLKGDKISSGKLAFLKEKLKDNSAVSELKSYYEDILADLQVFPLEQEEKDSFTFGDTWSELRNYGGNRRHEGTDIFPEENIRGKYKVISATDGVVERLGWLNLGGYRVGIRSPHGGYFYYAHLDSYKEGLEVGDRIKAGDLLGYMGDSGYGAEGTKGMFPVHLHFGAYADTKLGELSVNPYGILLYLAP